MHPSSRLGGCMEPCRCYVQTTLAFLGLLCRSHASPSQQIWVEMMMKKQDAPLLHQPVSTSPSIVQAHEFSIKEQELKY